MLVATFFLVLYFFCDKRVIFVATKILLVAAPAMIHLQAALKTVNDTKTFLYGDCSDPGCNCSLQVTDCLGDVFLYSVLQITPKVNIWGLNRVSVWRPLSVTPTDESILESLPV